MADITNAINKFKTSVNGEDVRDGFVETMTLVNNDNIKISKDYAQIIIAAGQVGSAVSTATASATIATNKATEAVNSAATAAVSATTASTKASQAADSAATATTKATEATNAATTATTAKNIAVTKATEASDSATQAAASAALANDSAVRREVIDIKLKLDEMNVVEYLNKTGIGFFDLFEDSSNIDAGNTTAVMANTDVTFTGTQILQMNSQNFSDFTNVELAIYDLLREQFLVTVAVSNSPTISMNITPGSRTIGEKFYYNGEVYTITNVVAS